MSATTVLVLVSMCCRSSYAMLDQGIPSTPKIPDSEAAVLHQILNQESALRVELEKQIASLQTTVYNLQQEFLTLKNENRVLVRNMTGQSQDSIMFSAYLSKPINNPHADQVIIFDQAWTNTNHAYNTGSGMFTTPVSGFYQFSLTIASESVNTHVNLMHNGRPLARVIADIHHTGYYGRGSLSLIQHVNAGDSIWVASQDDRSNNVILGNSNPLTVFTGHLLQKD